MTIRSELIKATRSEGDGESQIYFDEDLRFMTISGIINWKMADMVFNTLTDFETKGKNPAKPVSVLINSEGGDILAGFKIYDHMRHYSTPYITIAAGIGCSAGLIIYMAGDRRLMFPHAVLRFHEPWRQSEDKAYPRESEEASRFHQLLFRQMIDVFLKREVKMSKKQIKDYLLVSKRIDAGTAVKLRLAHRIIAPNPKAPLRFNDYQRKFKPR